MILIKGKESHHNAKESKDRGPLKWSSMMLPEHKFSLSELEKEQNVIPRPLLTSNKLEEINTLLSIVLEKGSQAKFKIYTKYSFVEIEGRIICIDKINNVICIDNNNIIKINLPDIVDIIII